MFSTPILQPYILGIFWDRRINVIYIRPTFLSPLRCIVLFLCLFSSVFSSLFINCSNFSTISFFWSFPSVEGPHSNTLSSIRFSVFLRISFGVSSSSSSKAQGILAQGSRNLIAIATGRKSGNKTGGLKLASTSDASADHALDPNTEAQF